MVRQRRQRGFTVLELIIVVALLAITMGVLASTIRIGRPSARDKAVEMVALLKAARSMSIATGKMHRLVLDLEQGVMRIEICAEKTQIRRTQTDEFKEQAAKRRDKLAERAESGSSGDDGDIVRMLPDQLQNSPEFKQLMTTMDPSDIKDVAAAVEGDGEGLDNCSAPTLPNGDADGRGNERKFPDGIKVREVQVQHLSDPLREGQVSISFFPLGRSEKALVEIEDESEDEIYTVLVHSLSGRVELRKGRLRNPDDHMRRDGAGDKIEDDR